MNPTVINLNDVIKFIKFPFTYMNFTILSDKFVLKYKNVPPIDYKIILSSISLI